MTANNLPLNSEPGLIRIGGRAHALSDDAMEEEFQMRDIWCLHLYTYPGMLTVNGENHEIRPGAVSLTPPYAHVKFLFRERDSFHMSSFFRYADSSGPADRKDPVPFPVMSYPEKGIFDLCFDQIRRAARDYPLRMKKAQVAIWNILWTLTDSLGEDYRRLWRDPLPLDRAIQYMEYNFADPVSIPRIAVHAGVTPTHLARLFKERFALTPVAYLRRRRAREAEYYLTHTPLPIKEIAARVGIEDLSYFYKVMDREFGKTPGEIRNAPESRGSDL